MPVGDEIGGLFECVIWKTGVNNGKQYVWSNIYPLTNTEGFKPELAYECCHNMTMAEAGLHFSDTKMLGAILYEVGGASGGVTKDNCYGFSTWGNGSRGQEPWSVRLPWEWTLKITRTARFGRSAHFMYRNCISSAEAVRFKETDWALSNSTAFSLHHTAFWHHWIVTHPFTHAIFSRYDETQVPAVIRQVERLNISSLSKLQSQSDAQRRKTVLALSFKGLAEQCVVKAFEALSRVHVDQMWAPGDVPRGVALDWIPKVAELHGMLVSLKEFWESGMNPAVAESWRPTGAHDWWYNVAGSHRSQAETASGQWTQALKAALPEEVEWLDEMKAKDFRKDLNLIVWNVQRIMLSRFIGNPINALASQL